MPAQSISPAFRSDAAPGDGALPSGPIVVDHGDIRLTPVNRPSWRHGMTPFLMIFAPINLTAVFIADWHRLVAIFAAMGVTLLVAIARVGSYSGAHIRLHSNGLSYAGLVSPAHNVSAADITSAVILKIYDTASLLPTTQLFLLDAEERTRFRMRGRYWTDEQIEQVAAHFDVPIEQIDDPLTQVELRTARRAQLVWYERRPVLGGLATMAVALIIAMTIVGATLVATGAVSVPFRPLT